jgi:prophage regulatory protein
VAKVPNQDIFILRWSEVSLRTGFRSKSHVEQLERRGEFPQSVKIGVRAKGWVKDEIDGWLSARIATRDDTSL